MPNPQNERDRALCDEEWSLTWDRVDVKVTLRRLAKVRNLRTAATEAAFRPVFTCEVGRFSVLAGLSKLR